MACQFVENAVDVLVTFGGTKFLGEGNGLVDNDTIGHVDAVAEFEAAHAQQGAFDGIEFVDGPIEQRGEQCVQLFARWGYAVDDGLEILQVDNIEIVGINDLLDAYYLAYMLKYDSVHGRFGGTVEAGEGCMIVDGKTIRLTAERDPADLKWGVVVFSFV